MNPGGSSEQDPGWCREGETVGNVGGFSFHGPFLHVTTCFLVAGGTRRSHSCLLLITGSQLIVMPVPDESTSPDPVHAEPGGKPGDRRPAKGVLRRWFRPGRNPVTKERLETLVKQYRDKDPAEVCVPDGDAVAIPLETVREIAIKRVKIPGRYSHLLFPFGMYPAEPANAGYNASYQLAISAGDRDITVITPFSLDIKKTLVSLMGGRVHEIVDEYAPLL